MNMGEYVHSSEDTIICGNRDKLHGNQQDEQLLQTEYSRGTRVEVIISFKWLGVTFHRRRGSIVKLT